MSTSLHYASNDPATLQFPELNALLNPSELPDRPLGVALVGLGKYSTGQLGPALLQTKFCRLAGIVTGSAEKIPEWKNRYQLTDENIYNYQNFETIVGNAAIDIVYVALPNALHAEFVIKAAQAGKHVICEKPLAVSVEECDSMIEACHKAGVQLGVGYRLHYDPNHLAVMETGAKKTYGDIRDIHATHGMKGTSGWRLDKELAGGGPLMDLGIYCIQAAIYATGKEPVSVKVTSFAPASAKTGNDIEMDIQWEMEFDNGLIARCECSYQQQQNLLHVASEHGWIELSPAYSYNGLVAKAATGILKFPEVNQQVLQMDDFARAVWKKERSRVDGDMGKRDVALLAAIYRSMQSGQAEMV